MQKQKASPGKIVRFACFFVLGISIYGIFSYWFVNTVLLHKQLSFPFPVSTSPSITPKPTMTPAVSPSPRPIPSGRKTFSVSIGKKTGPQFQEGVIDPYDPPVKGTQTISVTITGKKQVASATLTMQTDTKTRKVPMEMVSGTAANGVWKGSWTVDDTYLYTYIATITATDGTETNSIDITLR